MIAHFTHTGMPGLLQAALQTDPTQWLDTRLWDDAAALYLLTPHAFTQEGQHLLPATPENEFRAQEVNAINTN
jgi:hypothetical protein